MVLKQPHLKWKMFSKQETLNPTNNEKYLVKTIGSKL